ncbi:MAG: AAA family ATPase, partial [Solirubrobacteraceae bacterium]
MGTESGAWLLERESDRAALVRCVEASAAGNGGLVVVEGRAGVGKTSLLAEARTSATEAGLQVLSARSSELELEFAFGVVRQLFEPVLAAASEQTRGELLAGAANLAAPLFEVTTIAEPPPDGDVSFARLHGLYWLAVNVALAHPTALVIDDLHWCDGPSVRWLLHVIRRLEGLPLMVVIATRPPQQARHALLITELLSDPVAAILQPSELGSESVVVLARELLGAEPDERFCATCHEVTGGNPLYLRALLSTLGAEGRAPTAENAARVRAIGPEPIARIVALRLSRLASVAEDLARAVAVLDGAADVQLAAQLAGVERDAAA